MAWRRDDGAPRRIRLLPTISSQVHAHISRLSLPIHADLQSVRCISARCGDDGASRCTRLQLTISSQVHAHIFCSPVPIHVDLQSVLLPAQVNLRSALPTVRPIPTPPAYTDVLQPTPTFQGKSPHSDHPRIADRIRPLFSRGDRRSEHNFLARITNPTLFLTLRPCQQ